MSVQITFAAWQVPALLTILMVGFIFLVMAGDRRAGGPMAGLYTAFSIVAAIIAVVCSWITYFLVRWLS